MTKISVGYIAFAMSDTVTLQYRYSVHFLKCCDVLRTKVFCSENVDGCWRA